MDLNRNRTNNTQSKPKHIPRLTKEMYENRLRHNPFSSPPSSTGSHDTVSTTTEDMTRNLSNFSFSPDGEGTRRFSEQLQGHKRAGRSDRFGSRANTNLNTSAIARAFPEWSGLVTKDALAATQTFDFKGEPTIEEPKENVPPVEDTVDNTFEDALDAKRRRARAQMQARVDDESDCSSILSHLGRPTSGARRTRFSSAPVHVTPSSPPQPAKQSLQDMVSKIRDEKQNAQVHAYTRDLTPQATPPRQDSLLQPPSDHAEKTGISPTGRSFFLPGFRHLPDWTAGALKFSSMKNGVPVFIKSGRNGVQLGRTGDDHGAINGVGISEEDEEIFVSLDKLQEEVRELHDHDAMLQREAEKLQHEVNHLQAELKMSKESRKRPDSALGSESDGSFRRSNNNQDLEAQIALLQSRLDQASRQVGVNDIHSTALTAERDEALHQASVARERAMKLQAELEATQQDLELTLQYRHEKEAMELENKSLSAANETLKQQYDAAMQKNKTLSTQGDRLRRDLAAAQDELAATREELEAIHTQSEGLLEENKLISQDHASLERNNENYFKENKKLQAQVAARDSHIADLKKGISTRDAMIDKMDGLTTDTAIIELNAELETELDDLKQQIQEQAATLKEKEDRIRALEEQNVELSKENKRLRQRFEQMESQWEDAKQTTSRLSQELTKTSTQLRSLNDYNDDCVRLGDDFKQKEVVLRQKLDRREAAIKKVKQLANKISEITQQDITGKTTTKVTRIIEPGSTRQFTTDLTDRSNAMNVEEDPTTELHLTQGSDFISIMDDEIAKLKQTYRDVKEDQEERAKQAASSAVVEEVEDTELSLPILPGIRRSQSDASTRMSKAVTTTKALPAGILKKSSQFDLEEDTGRFSVKSALSIASHHTEDATHTGTINNTRRASNSVSGVQTTEQRSESRMRRNSETGRVVVDATVTEQNMTSAFFIPDITVHSEKEADTVPLQSFTDEARAVVEGLCKHKSGNCNVCIRIAASGEKTTFTASRRMTITTEDIRKGKKMVHVEKPVPVSERMPESKGHKYADEPTVRPSMAPGDALAILIKETQDEIDHLQIELQRLNNAYFGLDKALGQRERRRVMAEIKVMQNKLESKSGHLYKLHDVLEGQKQAGQLMTEEEIDITVLTGIVRFEATVESKDGSWNGFD
ncbi:protein Daple [Podospora conica]|nr:protein Daple [Schizothecium conicum]